MICLSLIWQHYNQLPAPPYAQTNLRTVIWGLPTFLIVALKTRKTTSSVSFPATQDWSVKCLWQYPPRLVLVLHNSTSSSWRSNRKWQSVISFSGLRRAESMSCAVNVIDVTSAVVRLHIETHKCSRSHTENDELWPHLSPCNTVTLWSCVRWLLGNSHFPSGCHSSGCYLQHCCSAAVSRPNSPLFSCTVSHYCSKITSPIWIVQVTKSIRWNRFNSLLQ